MKVKVRLAKEKDLPVFFNFFEHCIGKNFPEYSLMTRKYIVEEGYSFNKFGKGIKTGGIEIFLAFSGKKVVGFLFAKLQFGGVAWGDWFAVKKEYQRQGIASLLLKAWEKRAFQDGAHKLEFFTDNRNLNFYQERGFVLVGMIPDSYFGADDYLFYKTLRKSDEKKFLKDYLKEEKKIK